MTDPTQQWRRLLAAEPYEALVERVADPGTVSQMAMRALVLGEDLQPPAALKAAYEQARATSWRDGLGLTRAATLLAATGAAIDPAPVLRPWVGAEVSDDHERTALALACAAHGFDDALGELEPFVAIFPLRLETEGLCWSDLLFAGYTVYVRIAALEPAEVLDAIRRFVREVAAA